MNVIGSILLYVYSLHLQMYKTAHKRCLLSSAYDNTLSVLLSQVST